MFKVMFIDDDPMVLRMASFMMKKSGYVSVTAQSGEEGLAAAAAESPALIMVDAEMPGTDGFEVTRQLTSGQTAAPVCMMSGTITDEIRAQALSAGAIDIIEKPLKAPDIIRIIGQIKTEG